MDRFRPPPESSPHHHHTVSVQEWERLKHDYEWSVATSSARMLRREQAREHDEAAGGAPADEASA